MRGQSSVDQRARARIADVARAAGVSKTAVSFAFNRPERLSVETAGRIRDVAETLGYYPHPVARMLAHRRTMTLGVLTPRSLAETFANPYFGPFTEGLAGAAEAEGYDLRFLSPYRGSLALALGRASVDGVIVVGLSTDHPEVGEIRRAGVPLVLVDSGDLPALASVMVDDEAGARAAAEHVLELGHRDVLIVALEGAAGSSSPEPAGARRGGTGRRQPARATAASGVTERRLRGYRGALAEAGIEPRNASVRLAPATIQGGAGALRDAWAAGLRPTAVLAMSDGQAIGVIAAARELGRTIPGDLSVVGFDDVDIAAWLDPPLTTVRQPVRDKGIEAVRMLTEAVADPATPARTMRLRLELIVRGSTGPGPWHDPAHA